MKIKSILGKNVVWFSLFLSVVFFITAVLKYPGGNDININSTEYSWTANYISNLLEYKAVNGMENSARPFGVIGVILWELSLGLAFVRLSQKIYIKKYSIVLKYLGIIFSTISALIILPSLHDLILTLSSITGLLLVFYVIFLLIESRLQLLKLISIILLIVIFSSDYMYYNKTGGGYWPIIQKTTYILYMTWVLGLEYSTNKKDFEYIKS